MIGFVELFCRDQRHAPFNAGLIRTLCCAFPGERITVACAEDHYQGVFNHIAPAERDQLVLHTIDLPGRFGDAYHHVSIPRLIAEFRLLRNLVTSAPALRLLVVSSLTSTGLFAARLLLQTRQARNLAIHCVLHDNAGAIDGWRSRNPLMRAFDMESALRRTTGPRLRMIVLEDPIRVRLEERIPALRGRVDGLQQAIDPNESGGETITDLPKLEVPARIGFLGMATRAKGFDTFLRIANDIARSHPGAVEFHGVGMLHSEFERVDQSSLRVPMTRGGLVRADFARAMLRLHYACLPYSGVYYQLIASGVLVDAISWCKPILAIAQPVLSEAFERFGDIGYLCRDEAELRSVILNIAERPDPLRYAEQLKAIAAMRATRLPAALGRAYRETVGRVFPASIPERSIDDSA